MYDLECPYCGFKQDVDHVEDCQMENVEHETECCSCDKTFIFTTEVSFYYSAEIKD